jgi:ankyrin repeat protein
MATSSENVSLLDLLSVPHQSAERVLRALAEEADVNESSSRGFTPLMFAALFNDDPTIVRALIERGAQVDAETEAGMTALMWSLLTETRDHTGKGLTALLQREENRRAVALEIIKHGADVNVLCRFPRWMKWTPLLFATLAPDSNASVISALIAAGAGVNAQTMDGITPLINVAAFGRSSDVARELIRAGADVNAASKQEGRKGWTPLLYALVSPYKSLAIVRELVLSKADVNLVAAGGYTPLSFAVNIGDDPSFVSLLIEAGAKVEVQDKSGSTPLDYARAKNHKNVVNLLLKAKKTGLGMSTRSTPLC